ncbi:hypothetical protein Tco_1378575 [Tanacetum coccineum]
MVKSWLVQDQTVLGKDYSNLLIADSLLKTIWFINAPCYGNEALASPKANDVTEQGTKKRKGGHIKMLARKRKRPQSDVDSDESIEIRQDSSLEGDYLVIYRANGNFRAFNYLLELEDGTVIHMLVERRYPLSKDLMQRMLDFGLEVEIESTITLDLIRFIKQQIDEE